MKPKPLKSKGEASADFKGYMYYDFDVKSAVEWLKKEIRKVRKISHPISNNDLYELIDKAFEDVS